MLDKIGHVMVLYSPDWTNIGFSFILPTVNLFRHPTPARTIRDNVLLNNCDQNITSLSCAKRLLKVLPDWRQNKVVDFVSHMLI